MSDKKNERISQLVTPKRMNVAKECCNEWASLHAAGNHLKVMHSEIKVLCNNIIVCAEIPFSKNS